MTLKTLLIAPLLALAVACVAQGNGPQLSEEAPAIPGITRVEPGTKIEDIKSDPFNMKNVSVKDGILSIEVSYAGGNEQHEFTLYWNGIVARSYPGKTRVVLKHNANNDAAEALITETLKFDLAKMTKPMIITVMNDHGDQTTVQYGQANIR